MMKLITSALGLVACSRLAPAFAQMGLVPPWVHAAGAVRRRPGERGPD